MKNKLEWKLSADNEHFIRKLMNRTVSSVSQKNMYGLFGKSIEWKGEFDGDEYFMITVAGGVIVGSVSDRELPLSYTAELIGVHCALKKRNNESIGYQLTSDIKPSIEEAINKLTFDKIMKLLKWKYTSKKVEIYLDLFSTENYV